MRVDADAPSIPWPHACDWNPIADREALIIRDDPVAPGDLHDLAEYDGSGWQLCRSCARLERFRALRMVPMATRRPWRLARR